MQRLSQSDGWAFSVLTAAMWHNDHIGQPSAARANRLLPLTPWINHPGLTGDSPAFLPDDAQFGQFPRVATEIEQGTEFSDEPYLCIVDGTVKHEPSHLQVLVDPADYGCFVLRRKGVVALVDFPGQGSRSRPMTGNSSDASEKRSVPLRP